MPLAFLVTVPAPPGTCARFGFTGRRDWIASGNVFSSKWNLIENSGIFEELHFHTNPFRTAYAAVPCDQEDAVRA